MARKGMDPVVKQNIKNFGNKVAMAAAPTGLLGEVIGQGSQMAVSHPYGAGALGGVIGAGIGVAGALIHQRGMAVGRKQHLDDAANNARR